MRELCENTCINISYNVLSIYQIGLEVRLWMKSIKPHNSTKYYYPHFTDDKIEAQTG